MDQQNSPPVVSPGHNVSSHDNTTTTTYPTNEKSASTAHAPPLPDTASIGLAKHKAAEKDTEEFPEGGRGWLVVAGTFVLMGCSFGFASIYGQYQTYYLERFPTTPQTVLTLIGSLQPFFIYFCAIPSTIFIKKVGPHVAVAVSGLILVFSLMMVSLCNQVWHFALAQGVLFGVGSSISVFVSYTMPQQWFKKRRATAIGIVASGSSVGGLLWPIALHRLTLSVGFQWANRIMAFIFIPLMAFATFAVKSREHLIGVPQESLQSAEESTRDEEERAGEEDETVYVEYATESTQHQPDGISRVEDSSYTEHECKNSDTITTPQPDTASCSSGASQHSVLSDETITRQKHWVRRYVLHSRFLVDWSVLKNYHYALILFGNFIGFFGLFNPLFFIAPYAQVVGIAPNILEYIVTITNSGSVLGRILPGIIGDKIGRLNMLIMAVLGSSIVALALWLPAHSTALVFIAGFSYGMTSGALVSLAPAALGQLFGYHGLQSRLSIFFLACSPGSLVGPIIGGSFLPTQQDSFIDGKGNLQGYNKLIIFTGLMFLGSAAILTFVRFSINRKIFAFV